MTMNESQEAEIRMLKRVLATRDDEIDCERAEILADICAAQLLSDDESRQRYPDLWHHFYVCRDCFVDYRELLNSAQREVTGELIQPTVIPPVPTSKTNLPNWVEIKEALHKGREWVKGQMDDIYVMLVPPTLNKQEAVWTLLAESSGELLHERFIEVKDERGTWEIAISAIVEDDEKCQVDISLANLAHPNADLSNIAITLQYADSTKSAKTDENGLLFFTQVPREYLDELVVRIESIG